LLRQEPWECLASFILSSTKQIIQIQQIVKNLCNCHGHEIKTAPHVVPPLGGSLPSSVPSVPSCKIFSFPSAPRLASLTETQLRSCKMGFRAPYLLKTAQIISSGALNLESLRTLPTSAARDALCEL